MMRRVSYGNSTHLNISVLVGNDNKAFLEVALDRRDKDYFACDAGCLDPPVQLSTTAKMFPVKLTDPVTAVLYITSDYQHMQELKHTIHVSQVNDGEQEDTRLKNGFRIIFVFFSTTTRTSCDSPPQARKQVGRPPHHLLVFRGLPDYRVSRIFVQVDLARVLRRRGPIQSKVSSHKKCHAFCMLSRFFSSSTRLIIFRCQKCRTLSNKDSIVVDYND